jgi:hypothetical protein
MAFKGKQKVTKKSSRLKGPKAPPGANSGFTSAVSSGLLKLQNSDFFGMSAQKQPNFGPFNPFSMTDTKLGMNSPQTGEFSHAYVKNVGAPQSRLFYTDQKQDFLRDSANFTSENLIQLTSNSKEDHNLFSNT